MTHASLFSGIGGFDLAAEWIGWDNIFHCEWNPFGQKVLAHHFPNSISYNDITKTDFSIHRGQVDILTGGFPCQPYSSAGKRLGKADERHLFPEMLRTIEEVEPTWVVGENVLGIVNWGGGLVFQEVQTDLENKGYEVQAYILPACGKNAPHKRERTWFIAYSKLYENKHSNNRRSKQKEGDLRRKNEGNVFNTYNSDGIIANSNSSRVHEQHIASDSNKEIKFSGSSFKRRDFSRFPSKSPICGGDDGISRELDGITFSKWKNESLKAYGNAIVPQVAFEIFKAIQSFEDMVNV
jgi:DNA (cytosine-5)-methyltransferase 1